MLGVACLLTPLLRPFVIGAVYLGPLGFLLLTAAVVVATILPSRDAERELLTAAREAETEDYPIHIYVVPA